MSQLADLHTRVIVLFGRTRRRRANLMALALAGIGLVILSQLHLL